MGQPLSLTLCCLAIALWCVAVVLMLSEFVDYLHTGRWRSLMLLELAYDTGAIRARWFLAHEWSWPIHHALERLPVSLLALAFAPPCWWLGRWLARR